jgi:hypothetical protein
MQMLRRLSGLAGMVLLSQAPSSPGLAATPDAAEIVRKGEQVRNIPHLVSDATLVTGGAGQQTKTKKFTWWRGLNSRGTNFHRLARFTSPPEIHGEAVLLLGQDHDVVDVLLYLPAFKKIRRIDLHAQRSSFMQSAFSYSDLAVPHAEESRHRYLRSEACPGQPASRCHVIESVPTPELADRTGYGRTVQWVHSGNFVPIAVDCYDGDNKLVKKMTASAIEELDAAAHKWVARLIRIEEPGTGRFAEIRFDNIRLTPIPESVFTEDFLRQGDADKPPGAAPTTPVTR